MVRETGFRWTILGLALSTMSGCSLFGGMDGTWVFQWDRSSFQEVSKLETDDDSNAVEGPECSSSGSYPLRSMDGTTYSFVEIYLTKGTGIVVSVDGQELVGTVDGNNFEVKAAFEEVIWADDETYDQMRVAPATLGSAVDYVVEQSTAMIQLFGDEVVGVDLPASVELSIVETEPGVQGDRVSGARKPATLETGLVVQVPLFIENGERVKVDTRSGEYLSRA